MVIFGKKKAKSDQTDDQDSLLLDSPNCTVLKKIIRRAYPELS